MLGYNPIPDGNDGKYINPDGTFNQTLFDSDMGQHYWQGSVYVFDPLRDKM